MSYKKFYVFICRIKKIYVFICRLILSDIYIQALFPDVMICDGIRKHFWSVSNGMV